MSNDFRIRIRPLPLDSYEENYYRWTPSVATAHDRRILHTIIIRCYQYLQTGNSRVWGSYFSAPDGRYWRMYVCVGNRYLEQLGVRRQRQAVKQLVAKMRRLLAKKSGSRRLNFIFPTTKEEKYYGSFQ